MEEIRDFYKYSSEIRRYGYVYRGYHDNDSFSNLLNEYRIDIPDRKIVITLKESNFSKEICVSYSDLLESRYLDLNIISESFTKSERTTQERYGMVYQVELIENLNIIKEIIDNIDKDAALIDKITKGFDLVFDNVFKGFHLFGLYNRKLLGADFKEIKTTSKERIKRLRNNKVRIELYKDCNFNFNKELIPLELIKREIEKSSEYKTKHEDIKQFLNYEIVIEIDNNELYLTFKELNIIDRIRNVIK